MLIKIGTEHFERDIRCFDGITTPIHVLKTKCLPNLFAGQTRHMQLVDAFEWNHLLHKNIGTRCSYLWVITTLYSPVRWEVVCWYYL